MHWNSVDLPFQYQKELDGNTMNEQEKQEVEFIRLELLEMFKNSTMFSSVVFRITGRLWKLSHRKNPINKDNI